ncbi:MAG: hypothetical protein AB1716_04300 [Planctomycetota bacterium]
MTRKLIVAFGLGLICASAFAQVQIPRVCGTDVGSLLIYPKVELRWNAAGELTQDTFISINNDYPEDVWVLLYFISEPCTWVDNDIVLTHNEPAYWSALTGLPKGVSPFEVAAARYPDPEGGTDFVLRGTIFAWAINNQHQQIRWNHLYGTMTFVNYARGDAWEANAYAFQANGVTQGQVVGAPGTLLLTGTGAAYDIGYEYLLMDFVASGAQAYSGAGRTVTHDTDLTLVIVDQDLRQETRGPPLTKVIFDIWNENEVSFSGTEFCLEKWTQVLLSNIGGPFLVNNLHTNFGRARIRSVASQLCLPDPPTNPPSAAHSLLGLTAKVLNFDGSRIATAGTNMFGAGNRPTAILYDVLPGGGEGPMTLPTANEAAQLGNGHGN